MNKTAVCAAFLGLIALHAEAAVTFTSISQDNDGVVTNTTLQDRGPGTRGSTQVLTGTAVTEATPYSTFAFTLELTGNGTSPIPGSTAANLQFTVTGDPVAFSNAQSEQFFNVTGTPTPVVGSSGVLNPGNYVITSNANEATTTADDVLTLSLTISQVPEPSTALLGLLGMVALLRRRR